MNGLVVDAASSWHGSMHLADSNMLLRASSCKRVTAQSPLLCLAQTQVLQVGAVIVVCTSWPMHNVCMCHHVHQMVIRATKNEH